MSCCSHLPENSNVTPKTPNGCEECLKLGDRWIHLRLCATCATWVLASWTQSARRGVSSCAMLVGI